MIHTCPRCAYATPYRHVLAAHLARKKPCAVVRSDAGGRGPQPAAIGMERRVGEQQHEEKEADTNVEDEFLRPENRIGAATRETAATESRAAVSAVREGGSKEGEEREEAAAAPDVKTTTKRFHCFCCGRRFAHKNNVYRHQKTSGCCRGAGQRKGRGREMTSSSYRDDDDDAEAGARTGADKVTFLKSEVRELRDRVERLSASPDAAARSSWGSSQNNITINNNHTIHINAFGKEDVRGVLTEQMLDQCLRRTSLGLLELVRKIHFENTSNQNIRASLELPAHVIECHDGSGWKFDYKKEVLQRIVDNGHRIMSDHFDDNTPRLKNEMSNALFDYVCDWLRKMEKSNHKLYTEVMEKVFILILNQSKMAASCRV